MRQVEGMSHDEIANSLGISVDMVHKAPHARCGSPLPRARVNTAPMPS